MIVRRVKVDGAVTVHLENIQICEAVNKRRWSG